MLLPLVLGLGSIQAPVKWKNPYPTTSLLLASTLAVSKPTLPHRHGEWEGWFGHQGGGGVRVFQWFVFVNFSYRWG
jgi:hypothetical protein